MKKICNNTKISMIYIIIDGFSRYYRYIKYRDMGTKYKLLHFYLNNLLYWRVSYKNDNNYIKRNRLFPPALKFIKTSCSLE